MSCADKSALLARTASRTSDRPEYLGWVLARYAEAEKTTDEMMAKLLRLPAHDLHRVRLCLRPRNEAFVADVDQVARKFGLDAAFLAQVIRHVDALQGMKPRGEVEVTNDAGLLMAARTRNKNSMTPARGKNHGPRSK